MPGALIIRLTPLFLRKWGESAASHKKIIKNMYNFLSKKLLSSVHCPREETKAKQKELGKATEKLNLHLS